MFGIKKLQRDIDKLREEILDHNSFVSANKELWKAIEGLQVALRKVDAMQNDAKGSQGSLNIKLSNLFDKITPYSQTIDTLIVYARQVDLLCDRVDANTKALGDMQHSINQMLEHQKKIMEFMDVQDRINQDLIAVIETYGPVKKIPKLPKKIPAINKAS